MKFNLIVKDVEDITFIREWKIEAEFIIDAQTATEAMQILQSVLPYHAGMKITLPPWVERSEHMGDGNCKDNCSCIVGN